MQKLIENLTSQLGISSEQAEGALGALTKLAKENLGDSDFSQLAEKLPGLTDTMAKAPETGGGGIGGMLGSALGGITGGSVGNLATLATGFSKLGLDADMVAKFMPIVQKYVEENGGDIAKNLLGKVF